MARDLEAVTGSSMAEAARERGFRVREEIIEREELPGGTIHRLTLDHGDRGTAFVDLYDLAHVEAHATHPAVRVGADKTLYVHIMGGTTTSSSLLALLAGDSLEEVTRTSIERRLTGEGWTLGDSSRFEDDIDGHRIVDVGARRGDARVIVVLLDYSRITSGESRSVMVVDDRRLLLVDMEKRRWSERLLAGLIGAASG